MLEVNPKLLRKRLLWTGRCLLGKSFPDTYWWLTISEVQANSPKTYDIAASGETFATTCKIGSRRLNLISIDFPWHTVQSAGMLNS